MQIRSAAKWIAAAAGILVGDGDQPVPVRVRLHRGEHLAAACQLAGGGEVRMERVEVDLEARRRGHANSLAD